MASIEMAITIRLHNYRLEYPKLHLQLEIAGAPPEWAEFTLPDATDEELAQLIERIEAWKAS